MALPVKQAPRTGAPTTRPRPRNSVRLSLDLDDPAHVQALQLAVSAHKLATQREACEALGCSLRTLYRLRALGMPVTFLITSPRYNLAEIRAWLASRNELRLA